METSTQNALPVALDRLVRRCAVWNETQGTCHTPETYDEERTRYPAMVMWDLGWEQCETKLRAISAQFRKEADDLASFEQPRVQGAVIAYRDMADKLDAMFSPPNVKEHAPPLAGASGETGVDS